MKLIILALFLLGGCVTPKCKEKSPADHPKDAPYADQKECEGFDGY